MHFDRDQLGLHAGQGATIEDGEAHNKIPKLKTLNS
jgi:hypothetical protein